MSWIRCVFLLTLIIHQSDCQLSIEDLISRALSLVRPIFDTSQPLQNDDMLRKQPEPSPDDLRDSSILGARHHSPLDDLPLCKGNNRICQFISCSAENFKKDPAFGNIQLGVQVLGDAKLRKAISSNPEAIDAVCKEQGMDGGQCKIFSKGFQLIDKFITTIEKPADGKPETKTRTSQSDPIPIPINRDTEERFDDYEILPPSPPNSPGHRVHGSKTWSSNPVQNNPQLLDVRNDLVASLTPPPIWVPPTLAPFTPPTTPTAPPLAFPTVPSLILPSFKLPSLEKYFSTEKFLFGTPMKSDPELRLRRSLGMSVTEEDVDGHLREKRGDYYDDLQPTEAAPEKSEGSSTNDNSDDYYGAFEDPVADKPVDESPFKNCVNLLG